MYCVKSHLTPSARGGLADIYRFYDSTPACKKLLGKIKIDGFALKSNHQYNYRCKGVYGYVLLDLDEDTLTVWRLSND